MRYRRVAEDTAGDSGTTGLKWRIKNERSKREPVLFRTASVAASDQRRYRVAGHARIACGLDQRPELGADRRLRGFVVAALYVVALVRRRDRGIGRRYVRQECRPLVSLEHELVHLLRSDVLRRIFRRVVLCA